LQRFVRCAWLILFNCAGWCALWAQNSVCDAQVHPLQGSPVQYKERGNRCEGLYIAEVGSQKLDLVSFHWGALNYTLKPGQKLIVSVPGVRVPVHVRAMAIPLGTYYRMDAVLQPGASLAWPVDDVLLPEQLNASRLGVYAFAQGPNSEVVYYPVRVGTSTGGANDSHWVYTIRPSFDVQRVQWRAATVVGGNCSPFGAWQAVPNSDVAAGQSFDLGSSGMAGQHCIEVNAEGDSGWSKTPLRIRVEIPAP
jgi:hypothetical protein